ncbi:hypothetical protein F2Q70_00033372 [Brassica cretica]|uniref:Uncharacterized protein n=1 Tax=Brassica cretica TaxID=69181 RepID=A0A8S9FIH2_BRACR|nr:hypothetical protein F2Q70_00033372 [Brassica cretica]
MIWAMTELAKNPRVMRKAQEEIRNTLGLKKESITEEDIDKVDYLKLIIKETFRLHPALPLLLITIFIPGWTIGRDPGGDLTHLLNLPPRLDSSVKNRAAGAAFSCADMPARNSMAEALSTNGAQL